MNGSETYATTEDVQNNTGHFPGFLQLQYVTIKFGIMNDSRAS
jgi:hypothetical protein